jgi:hypothetical protein
VLKSCLRGRGPKTVEPPTGDQAAPAPMTATIDDMQTAGSAGIIRGIMNPNAEWPPYHGAAIKSTAAGTFKAGRGNSKTTSTKSRNAAQAPGARKSSGIESSADVAGIVPADDTISRRIVRGTVNLLDAAVRTYYCLIEWVDGGSSLVLSTSKGTQKDLYTDVHRLIADFDKVYSKNDGRAETTFVLHMTPSRIPDDTFPDCEEGDIWLFWVQWYS